MISELSFSPPQQKVLEHARSVARERSLTPLLVGGPVRDALAGRESNDVDLTLVEGSEDFARALAERLDGVVKTFPRFMTFKVLSREHPPIDVATTRSERYPHPGALPLVVRSGLHEDLRRRDFSINALAVDLRSGLLIDPFGGRNDLEGRVIRVLHDQSFADDPTRIVRALRFSVRLGSILEADTERFLREAIRAGALHRLSRQRVWREMYLAMREAEPERVFAELERFGAITSFLGSQSNGGRDARATGPRSPEQLEASLRAVRLRFDNHPRARLDLAFLGLLLRDGGQWSGEHLHGAGLGRREIEVVKEIATDLPSLRGAIADASSDEAIFEVCHRAHRESLIVVATEHERTGTRDEESSGRIARYFAFEATAVPFNGSDLGLEAGPHIARALEATRLRLFRREISAGEALSFARASALEYLRDARTLPRQ